MQFTYKFQFPRLDLDGYKRTLDKHMREVLVKALMEWLDAVLLEIPNWTGASRATFWRLGETISMGVGASGLRVAIGQAAGSGELNADEAKGVYTFTYGTTLPWLIWNEYHNANIDPDPTKYPPPAKLRKPGPYHFQEKGAKVFQKFADTVELPKVAPYLKPVSIEK